MKKENMRRYFQFFLIVLAAGVIYPVIYLRTNYQETMLTVFNLGLPDLNNFYSLLGMAFVVGYIPSGLLSDRFSAKWLISISLIGTAVCGFWFAQVPSKGAVNIIFILWGIFSVFTFWSSHMKIVKMLAKSSEEGRFFGILDGGRGVIEALMGTLGLAFFAAILGTSTTVADKTSALVFVITLYSAITLVTGVLIAIFVENDEKLSKHAEHKGERAESEKFHLADVGTLLKNKFVYLMGGIIFMGYAVYWTVYYVGGFLQTNVGVSAVTVGTVTVIVLWMRPVGGFIGGFLADKIGRTKTISGAIIGGSVLLVITAITPVTTSPMLFYVLIILLGAFLYAIRGTYWSILGQSKIQASMMGTAIGLISFIGYLPDIILPQMNTALWNTFGDNGGYNAYFLVSAALGVAGVLIIIVYNRMHKASLAKIIVEPVMVTK
ncbi:MAG: MFS transporter [Spirochaetia bacterium]|nr:MFS transporter [Spirochaetia bacterium]